MHTYLFEFTAPSAPRDVTVRLMTPRVAEVSWRMPAVTNGVINRYIVYAIPLGGTTRQRRQALAITTPQTVQTVYYKQIQYRHSKDCIHITYSYMQFFSGTATAGNVTLTNHSITYEFRVSAAINYDRTDPQRGRALNSHCKLNRICP